MTVTRSELRTDPCDDRGDVAQQGQTGLAFAFLSGHQRFKIQDFKPPTGATRGGPETRESPDPLTEVHARSDPSKTHPNVPRPPKTPSLSLSLRFRKPATNQSNPLRPTQPLRSGSRDLSLRAGRERLRVCYCRAIRRPFCRQTAPRRPSPAHEATRMRLRCQPRRPSCRYRRHRYGRQHHHCGIEPHTGGEGTAWRPPAAATAREPLVGSYPPLPMSGHQRWEI